MPEVILNCPQCGRTLRVAEDLLGRLVQCPACGLNLSVPAPGTAPRSACHAPAGGEAPPFRVPDAAYAPGEEYDDERGWEHERARSLVMAPAICLLVASILGILGDLFQAFLWITMPDVLIKQVEAFGFGQPPPAQVLVIVHACFAVLSLLILVAAVQMLRMRVYGLALIGSFLALVNCDSYCCLLGFPLGIWSLIVLFRPEVRSAFQ